MLIAPGGSIYSWLSTTTWLTFSFSHPDSLTSTNVPSTCVGVEEATVFPWEICSGTVTGANVSLLSPRREDVSLGGRLAPDVDTATDGNGTPPSEATPPFVPDTTGMARGIVTNGDRPTVGVNVLVRLVE